MPELPDLAVVAEAFHAALAGRPVDEARALAPLAVRGTPDELAALAGRRLERVARRGKFLLFDLLPDRVVVSPMLTGRFQLSRPGTKLPARTALVIGFGARTTGMPIDAAAWTIGADWVPDGGARPEIRYRDPTQMGKVYLLPAGVARLVPGLDDELGPDADDPGLTIEMWRARIRRHPGELKNLLRNQAFVAGIGNAYSDEILHAARLLPSRRRSTLAADEVDELYHVTRRTLADAIGILRSRVAPTFETQVRDFFAVHGRAGLPCPRCGSRITEVTPGGVPTAYCRGCQR